MNEGLFFFTRFAFKNSSPGSRFVVAVCVRVSVVRVGAATGLATVVCFGR